ncbi:MAG: PIG-L family deacetylase [Thermogutta sp.]
MSSVRRIWDQRNAQEESLDVLVVGAHPDDVEIGCGGFVNSLISQGFRVGIVDLTDGEPTPGCPHPNQRMDEAIEAARVLGVQCRVILDLPNRRLFDNFESRLALAEQMRIYRPRIVLGLGLKTPLASPDHEQAAHITEAGVFYARLSKWDEFFGNLPPHQVAIYLHYYLPLRFPVLPAPNAVVVDIGKSLKAKMDAIGCYSSQFAHRPEILERISLFNRSLGQTVGFEAGEFIGHPTGWGFRALISGILGDTKQP